MNDRELLAVCIADEAANQGHAGRVAVGRVVMNRTLRRYSSDGTIPGTILSPNQFSGFYFDFVDGKYTRVVHSQFEAEARAKYKLKRYSAAPLLWTDCLLAADHATGAVAYSSADMPAQVRAYAVLYYNPKLIKTAPAWAKPAANLGAIEDHTFFSDGG